VGYLLAEGKPASVAVPLEGLKALGSDAGTPE
jgi:hypothetical protein